VSEIEILKKRKKEEIDRHKVDEVKNLQKIADELYKQCMYEENEEILLILHL
ncbi:hypothetical protein EMCG_05525, partial [[Emmonsia] crescens]